MLIDPVNILTIIIINYSHKLVSDGINPYKGKSKIYKARTSS